MKITYAQVSQEERDKYYEEQSRIKAAQQSVQRMGLLVRLFKWLAQIAHR
jgi:hypothetical protein